MQYIRNILILKKVDFYINRISIVILQSKVLNRDNPDLYERILFKEIYGSFIYNNLN